MALGQYFGVGGVARKAKGQFLGVGGVARKIKQGLLGVAGVARKFYAGETVIHVHGTNVATSGNGVYLYGQTVPAFSRVYGTIRLPYGYYEVRYQGYPVGSVEVPYDEDEETVSVSTSSGSDHYCYDYYAETWDDSGSYVHEACLNMSFAQDRVTLTLDIPCHVTTGESSHNVTAGGAVKKNIDFDLYFVCES